MNNSKVITIVGPTATGKTDLALQLAKQFNGEIISCDSRQVYKGLDIGTGKMPGSEVEVEKHDGFWIMNGIMIHMYDVVGPSVRFTVKDYVDQVNRILEDVLQREKLPIIVGGTGLYLKGLLEGFGNLEVPLDTQLRNELEQLSKEELQQRLKSVSPDKFEAMNNSDQNNPRRLVRAIEIVSMYPYVSPTGNTQEIKNPYDVLKIGLTAPREVLNERINSRVDKRIDQGMVSEAVELRKEGLSLQRMHELGLEYRYLADVLTGKLSKEQFKKLLKVKIHQYAKRQMTWFQADPGIRWFDITDAEFNQKVAKTTSDWYNNQDDPQS